MFATAREKARQATCASNEKQLGLGFAQYEQDYDEVYPLAWSYDSGGNYLQIWDGEIKPYIGIKVAFTAAPLVFACPDDTLARTGGTAFQVRTYAEVTTVNGTTQVGISGDRISPPTGGQYAQGRNQSQVLAPAATILLAELPDPNNRFAIGSDATVGSPSAQQGAIAPMHSGGWNYLFCDSHVKWYRPEQTVGAAGTMTAPKGFWTIDPND